MAEYYLHEWLNISFFSVVSHGSGPADIVGPFSLN